MTARHDRRHWVASTGPPRSPRRRADGQAEHAADPRFNGAASVTEAEDHADRCHAREPRQASTGPPRSPRRRAVCHRMAQARNHRLQRGRLGHRGGGRSSNLYTLDDTKLQRGRLGHRGGGCGRRCTPFAGTRFNGAASVTEAEEARDMSLTLSGIGFNGAASVTDAEGSWPGGSAGCRSCFNGAASVTEAEVHDHDLARRWPAASTGPPR